MVSLFVKQLRQEQSDHPDKQQPDREIWIYEHLLKSEPQLPVVRYYGNESKDLFLEYINGQKLKYCEPDIWLLTAEKLATLHGYFMKRSELLQSSDFLLRLDADYFLNWAERAIQSLAEFPSRLQFDLGEIVARYDTIANLLASQQPTLVHNDLSPKNVLVDVNVKPPRICFVDWEVAGTGCGLLDLVYLKYKLNPEIGSRMVSHYCSALENVASAPFGRDLDLLLAACELHKIIYRLARRQAWNIPVEEVIQSIADAQRYLDLFL